MVYENHESRDTDDGVNDAGYPNQNHRSFALVSPAPCCPPAQAGTNDNKKSCSLRSGSGMNEIPLKGIVFETS
jgi:Protein of unknown function (DUF3175)